MAFGQDFLKGFAGVDGLKDYAHASKTFLTNGYELVPRTKYLFHVFFTINTAYIPALRNTIGNQDVATIGLMVKNIQLPNYSLSVETMNQYNRKRLIQTKIDYQPVQIEFHDDGGDLVRNMWYSYYSYYYKDPSQKYDNLAPNNGNLGPLAQTPNGFNYNARDIYDQSRAVNDWGYVGEAYSDGAAISTGSNPGKLPFFRDIRIYGLNQHKYASYILINPMITEWQHDTYDYSQGNGTMSNRMTIRYETVKYGTGAVGGVRPDTNVTGFADPAYYDTVRSSIARRGSNATVLGQGGLIDAGVGIAEDLASGSVAGIIGAAQKAVAVNQTFKGKDIRSIVNQDAKNSATTILKGSLPGATRAVIGTQGQRGTLDGVFFPTPPKGDTRSPAVTGAELTSALSRNARIAR